MDRRDLKNTGLKLRNPKVDIFKKKKIYLNFFSKDDLYVLRDLIYRDNYNNRNALKIKSIVEPITRRGLTFHEMRQLWLVISRNKCIYDEFTLMNNNINSESFTDIEFKKIVAYINSYTWSNLSYIDVKKRIYNGILKINDFKKIKKIIYSNFYTYEKYFELKCILEQCLDEKNLYKKNTETTITKKIKEVKESEFFTREEYLQMFNNPTPLNVSQMQKMWFSVEEMEAQGEDIRVEKTQRYYNPIRTRIHLDTLDEAPFIDPGYWSKVFFKEDGEEFENGALENPDDESDLDLAFYKYFIDDDRFSVNSIYNDYIGMNFLNLYFYSELLAKIKSTKFISADKIGISELEAEYMEENYWYFVYRYVNKFDEFLVVQGEPWGDHTEDLVNSYHTILEKKLPIGSKDALEYALIVKNSRNVKKSVSANAYSWWLQWRVTYKSFKKTWEYGIDMLKELEQFNLQLKEKKKTLVDFIRIYNDFNASNFDNNIEANIKINLGKKKTFKKLTLFILLNFVRFFLVQYVSIYILCYDLQKRVVKLNFFFKNNKNLKFKKFKYIFLLNKIIYLRIYKIKNYAKRIGVKKHDFPDIILNIIDHIIGQKRAWIAHSVERKTENLKVVSSILTSGIKFIIILVN